MKKTFMIIFLIIFIFALAFMLIYLSEKTEEFKIPKVYIEGDIFSFVQMEDEKKVLLKYESNNLKFEKYAIIKIQGNSSTKYEKKNYSIELYDDKEFNNKATIELQEKWGKQNTFCLKANWIDKTHSRNIVSARIAGKIQGRYNVFNDTPNNGLIDGFPIELYANDEFLGLYTWNIPKDTWTWNMDENNPEHLIVQGDEYENQTAFKEKIKDFQLSGWKIEIGDNSSYGKELMTNKLNRLIDFVINSTDEEFVKKFEEYFDKDSALNYLVGLYLFNANDNCIKNLILATKDGEKWYLNLYDLDTTFGTNYKGTELISYEWLPEEGNNKLLNRIIKCMAEELADRWFELRKDIITKEKIINEFQAFMNCIPEESLKKEQERWQNIPGYGMEQIEEYLDFRLDYVDNIMNIKHQEKTLNN